MTDNVILKKKLSTFRTKKGSLTKLTNEVLYEVLCGWEQWPGPIKDFYKSIGVSARQMASLIGKAKKLKREGAFPEEIFNEIMIQNSHEESQGLAQVIPMDATAPMEIKWEKGKTIRFYQVDHLVDFLKKVA